MGGNSGVRDFGEGFCADGECIQCRTKSDCGDDPDCQEWACNGGFCELEDKDGGSCRRTTGASGECRDGTCFECFEDDDCEPSSECKQRRCLLGGTCSLETNKADGSSCTPSGGGDGACSAGQCARLYSGRVCLDNSPTGGSVMYAETTDNVTVEVKFCGEAGFTRVGSRPLPSLSNCHEFAWDDAPTDKVQSIKLTISADEMFWLDRLTLYNDAGTQVWYDGVENGWGWCFSTYPDDGDSSFCRDPDDSSSPTDVATPTHTWNVDGC